MAAEADPKMLNPQHGRARLRIERREYAQALEAYKAAQALKPDHPEIPYGVGVAYHELKQPDLAIQWLNAAVRIKGSADAYYRLGQLYLDKNNASAAASAYGNATRLALDEERAGKGEVKWLTDAFWQLGQLQDTVGNGRGACDAYEKYLARNPNDVVKVKDTKNVMLSLRCR